METLCVKEWEEKKKKEKRQVTLSHTELIIASKWKQGISEKRLVCEGGMWLLVSAYEESENRYAAYSPLQQHVYISNVLMN